MLRSTRKEILKAVNTFLKNRKALLAMTPEQIAADVEIEGTHTYNGVGYPGALRTPYVGTIPRALPLS